MPRPGDLEDLQRLYQQQAETLTVLDQQVRLLRSAMVHLSLTVEVLHSLIASDELPGERVITARNDDPPEPEPASRSYRPPRVTH